MAATVNGKAEVWRRRIENQRLSGQGVRAWCKANEAHEHSFYFWRARLGLSRGKRRRQVLPGRRPLKPMDFARVVVGASPGAEPSVAGVVEPIRLRLGAERELILPASMPLEEVARLVHALEVAG